MSIGIPELLVIIIILVVLGGICLAVFLGIFGIVKFSSKDSSQNVAQASSMKRCPFCAETIQAEAKLCRFCGKELQI
jgi:hypothetical protein